MTWIPNWKFIIQAMIWIANLNSLFKPSVTQPISQTIYGLNSRLIVCYSGHVLNNVLLVRYSSHDLNNKPFQEQTILDNSNTELVRYSVPTICFIKSLPSTFFSLSALLREHNIRNQTPFLNEIDPFIFTSTWQIFNFKIFVSCACFYILLF